jgi:hypothetical protein
VDLVPVREAGGVGSEEHQHSSKKKKKKLVVMTATVDTGNCVQGISMFLA